MSSEQAMFIHMSVNFIFIFVIYTYVEVRRIRKAIEQIKEER